MRKIAFLLSVFYMASLLTGGLALAYDEEDAGEKAEEIHRLAISDVIFIDEELKALYYQNVQIISILNDIRELLRQKLEDIEENLKELKEIKEDLRSIKERQEKAE